MSNFIRATSQLDFYEGLDLKDLYQCKWLVEK